jgi:hypothetical protein
MTIGTLIVDFLTGSGTLLSLVPETSIYPVVANEDTPLPFIVYNHSIDSVEYEKDGWAYDACSFSVAVISNDYANLQDIITEVRAALELKRTSDTLRIQLTGTDEIEWVDGMFGQKMNFDIIIDTY